MYAGLAGLTTPNRLAMSHGHLEADALMWRSHLVTLKRLATDARAILADTLAGRVTSKDCMLAPGQYSLPIACGIMSKD